MPKCTVYLMFGLSIPIPNALVATSKGTLLFLNRTALSLFSVSHLSPASIPLGGRPEYNVTSVSVAFCATSRASVRPCTRALAVGTNTIPEAVFRPQGR